MEWMPPRGVEKSLSRALRALGASVGSHLWPFLLVSVVLSGASTTGFVFLPLRQPNDLDEQFTALGGPAKFERCFMKAHFPTDAAKNSSAERLSTQGTYATFIVVAARDGDSLLMRVAFAELLALDQAVRAQRRLLRQPQPAPERRPFLLSYKWNGQNYFLVPFILMIIFILGVLLSKKQ